jgi:hypothetical protein
MPINKILPVWPYAKQVAFVRWNINGTMGSTVSAYTWTERKKIATILVKPLNYQSMLLEELPLVKYLLHHLKHLHPAQHQKRTHVSRRILPSQPADIGDAETNQEKRYNIHPYK